MWDNIPLDILSHIFSFLPPTSIASSLSTSKHWHRAAALLTAPSHPSTWLLAVPTRAPYLASFAYDPSLNRWLSLPLSYFLPSLVRLVAPISSLLLCKLLSSQFLDLVLVNPFTKQYKSLPRLITPRSNPAIGVVLVSSLKVITANAHALQTCVTEILRPSAISNSHPPPFLIFVAGGTSGSSYEQTVEVYDSALGQWRNKNPMPLEFAVRLTVWTPNESVYGEHDGVLYWMTSARAFSVVGFEIKTGVWREVKVPMAERLEWGGLVKGKNGMVRVVGGDQGGSGWVWELEDGDEWREVGELPPLMELGGGSIKCVGGGENVFLFREIGDKMLVWDGREWRWIEGASCGCLHRTPMKVVAMQPTLSRFCLQDMRCR